MTTVRAFLSIVLGAILAATLSAPATAQFATSETLPADDLGLPGTVTLARPAASREIAVPVPDGTGFSGFTATVRVPGDVHQARLNVSVDGVELFEDVVAGGTELPIELDVETESREPVLRFAATEVAVRSCNAVTVEPVLVSIHDPVFEFSGIGGEATTVADFLPVHLHHMDIFVPADRTEAVDQAALRLATHLTHRYDSQPSFAVVEGSPDGRESTGPFDRAVLITESETGSLSVESDEARTYLKIAGDGEVLDQLAQTLTSPEAALLTSGTVRAQPAPTLAVGSSDDPKTEWTLSDLGLRSLDTEGALSLQLAVPMHQAQFGAPVRRIVARLTGFVTGEDTDPVLTVALNGETMSVLSLDDDGRFDTTVQIEGAQLGRENLLTVHSDIDLDCEDSLPWHRLQLSADSSVEVEFGQTLVPSLERFPQVALDGISVAPGYGAVGLEVAVNTVAALQQASRTILRPAVQTADDIVQNDATGLIVADSVELPGMPELIQPDSGRVVADGLEYSGAVAQSVSMIQAVEGPSGQDLLVVHLSDTSADRLIEQLAGQSWQLKGRAYGFDRDSEVRLSAVEGGPTGPLAFVEEDSRSIAESFGLGVVGAAILFGFVSLAGGLRRRLA